MLAAGLPVVAIASRSRAHAEQAAGIINAAARAASAAAVQTADLPEIPRLASHLLIAVADQGIGPVADALAAAGMETGIALHTCGAKGPEALQALGAAGVSCGMLHPLQTLIAGDQGVRTLAGVTFGLAGDPRALEWGEQIVTSLHGHPLRLDADRLSYYHAGAVMASNALLAALDATVALFGAAGIEPDVALRAIGPLARTSVSNAIDRGPQAALTGPVVRGDAATVAAHVRALRQADPSVARLYEAAAGHLLQMATRRGLSDEQVRALRAAISGHAG
jgi:predicted short-subunit dehydrogenase-like oxidoreductase (DUF2520 family)